MLPQFDAAFQSEEHYSYFRDGANGHAALLVHGFPGTPAEMRPPAELLHHLGWTVHAPLLPGFGPEVKMLAEKTLDDWYSTVKTAALHLRRTHQHIIYIGNSMGGALSLQLAAELPPDAVILFAPFWRVEHWLWGLLPVLKWVFPAFKPFRLFKPDFADPNTRQSIRNFMPDANLDDPQVRTAILDFAIPIAMIDQIRLAGVRGYEAAPHVACPILVIQGSGDELVLPSVTRQLIQQLAGAVQYSEIAGTHELLKPESVSWQHIIPLLTTFITPFMTTHPISHREVGHHA